MDQSSANQPRHERSVFDWIPEPPAAPAQFVVSPPASQSNANRQEHPGDGGPWSRPARPGRVEPAADQRRNRKRKRNRKSDIAHVQYWWVCHHCRVLEQRIEIAAINRGRNQARERV